MRESISIFNFSIWVFRMSIFQCKVGRGIQRGHWSCLLTSWEDRISYILSELEKSDTGTGNQKGVLEWSGWRVIQLGMYQYFYYVAGKTSGEITKMYLVFRTGDNLLPVMWMWKSSISVASTGGLGAEVLAGSLFGCARKNAEGFSHKLLSGWAQVKSGKINMRSHQHKMVNNFK